MSEGFSAMLRCRRDHRLKLAVWFLIKNILDVQWREENRRDALEDAFLAAQKRLQSLQQLEVVQFHNFHWEHLFHVGEMF